jgi:hypothetical protein
MNSIETQQTRQAVFNFVDGTQLIIEWPSASPDKVPDLAGMVQKAIASPLFTAQVGENLMVIQMANVNYVEIIPAPENLPPEVIRNARVQREE